jgi:hypothetical protein
VDAFELQTLPTHTRRPPQRNKETTRERKRREKLEQLLEADEMKFSHSLQFNSVPDWSSHYIAYSNLKKLYVLHCSPLGLRGSIWATERVSHTEGNR